MPVNRFQHARFLASASTLAQAPPDTGREAAFAGRSNAGKSSALNAITAQRALARTSKTPGRTQLINFFAVDDGRRLVDLPGYGYAQVSQAVKERWQRHLALYLERRQSLKGLILLMDIRHILTDYDQQMLGWCHHAQLPVHVLLTKADKLRRGPGLAILRQCEKQLSAIHHGASAQLFSAVKQTGVEQVREKLTEWLAMDAQHNEFH
jgi:GTP-binding protein